MSTIRKTITLTNQQSDWIKSRIHAGDFTNDSEYIRDLIRRDQQRASQVAAIQAAIDEGQNSGSATPLDMEEIKRKARQEAGRHEHITDNQ
ncbi:type II toxin-antitoxin system ParD family antitoxin [Bacterioplanoides sp. SCSIO 12839]|uniref:type II toxin-antitoxin system ParD family antitoxin n=1 Tax=Bacterioplanoides sp. SCSIO 12839 TaxID=2829569 RepID=UPI0021059DE1|nr:type II toxin-antitoxin system ParD family antitoxin [Bacterioplanoides sp. SCSIO 12839]UTW48358.1 type II toxin-antitoxin system ParD family antitoxin [Bacterioplanoides sp. SCSIO 12839]